MLMLDVSNIDILIVDIEAVLEKREKLMGKKVTRLWPFLKADYKAAEAYLTQQAARGLQFKSIGSYVFFAKYERTAPQQIQYCINVFSGNQEDRDSYIVLAEDAGWHLEDEMQGALFFASRNGDTPTPMETDWRSEYRQIRKWYRGYEMPVGIAVLIILVLTSRFLGLVDTTLLDFFSTLNLKDPAALWFILMAVFSGECLYRAAAFYVRSGIAIKRGAPLSLGSTSAAKGRGLVHTVLGVVTYTVYGIYGVRLLYGQLSLSASVKVIALWAALAGIAVLWIFVKLQGRMKEKTQKILTIAILLFIAIAFLTYCTASCEIVTEEG